MLNHTSFGMDTETRLENERRRMPHVSATYCQNDKTPNQSLSLKISVPCRIILNVSRNLFENGHGNIKYSTGNIASDIVITVCGVRWVTALLGDHCVRCVNV